MAARRKQTSSESKPRSPTDIPLHLATTPESTYQNKMKSLPIALTLIVGIFTGCASFATRTSVAMLDITPRPVKTGEIEVFQQGKKPIRPYKEIALFTVD